MRTAMRAICAGSTTSIITAVVGLALAFGTPRAFSDTHLLISEVKATGSGEYIEIYNPLNITVDLSNYYLSDHLRYSTITQLITDLSGTTDFIVRFPKGATIPAHGVITVAMSGDDFLQTYGFNPNFQIPPDFVPNPAPDMQPATPGSIGVFHGISDAGEWIFLFYWNQTSDLIRDVDIVRAGMPSAADAWPGKNGECWDGPDGDSTCTPYLHDAMTMPSMTAIAGAAQSYKRTFLEGAQENQCGGNGITGNDETSENIAATWDGNGVPFTAPTPGVVPPLTNPAPVCYADIVINSHVDVNDLLAVITHWGPCADCQACPWDIGPCRNCLVNVDDLLTVITSWGPCP